MASFTRDVNRFVLENGLTVLIKENHASPVAAVVAHANIGYFNEPDRWNGIAHVVEHMVFKGTRNRPGKEQIAEEVRALGGTLNAGTYYEETHYYIVVPSDRLGAAVEIQADMLRNPLIAPEELAKELEVIIQESKQKRDNPGSWLIESMYARAYDRHRIRRWRIGPDETLRALRRDDLAEFMGETYRPENLVVSVVGDIGTDQALRMVQQSWGDMERGVLRRETSPAEPDPQGFRYHRMTGDIQQRLFAVGFPAPGILADDAPALTISDYILSDGRSSRFYRSIKEDQRLANSVWADYEGFQEMGVFAMGADVSEDDPFAAEEALFRETRRLAEGGLSDAEMARVKTRVRSRVLFAQEEVNGVARSLAWYESLGGYHLWDEMLDRLDAVTADDVAAAAGRYFVPEKATLVEYLPNGTQAPTRTEAQVGRALVGEAPTARQTRGEDNGHEAEVATLPGGGSLLAKRRTDLPIVALHVLFPGGKSGETTATSGLTNLMLKSVLKGTESYSAAQIAETVEGLGSGIGLSLAADYFGFSLKILRDRLPEGLAVLREVIGRPSFPPGEVAKEKESIFAEIRRQHDSMSSRAIDLFNRACFADHPYGLPTSGIADAVASATVEDLRKWHSRWVHSAGACIGVVGDIGTEELVELLGDAIPPGENGQAGDRDVSFTGPREETVTVERQQTAAVMGFAGAAVDNDDRHALDVIAEIASGLAGRFFQAVRGDNALAYAVSASHRPRRHAGLFITYTATSPDKEEMARGILLRECERLASEPVGAKELADAKAAIRGEQVIHTQTFSAQAGELALHHLYGLPMNETERYLARIDAVTPEEVQQAAARYLTPDRFWLGVVRGAQG